MERLAGVSQGKRYRIIGALRQAAVGLLAWHPEPGTLTGQLEAINNRIKVMKRMAYGYRDSEYFFMKINTAFPGSP